MSKYHFVKQTDAKSRYHIYLSKDGSYIGLVWSIKWKGKTWRAFNARTTQLVTTWKTRKAAIAKLQDAWDKYYLNFGTT